MAHYFTNDDVMSDPEQFVFEFQGHSITLICDHGVFSRHKVDYGTRVLLNAIDVKDARSLLDVGCGYGPIGLSLKCTHPDLDVDMIDVNQRALALAQEGAVFNHCEDVNVFESNCYDNVEKNYDLIVSNPPVRAGKKVVSEIITGSQSHLNANGRLVIVLQKKQGAPSAKKLMETTFGNAEIIKRDKGYYIIQSSNTAKD